MNTLQPRLTARESQVLEHALTGGGSKQIAFDLGVSEQSVKEHLSTLFRKFGVRNRAALVEAASRLEFTGSLSVDRSSARQLIRESALQIGVLRGPELRYTSINQSFRDAVGERQVLGRTMREAFPELDGQGIFERVELAFARRETIVLSGWPVRGRRANTLDEQRLTIVLQPLRGNDGAVDGVIEYAVDVTGAVLPS